MLFNWPSRMLKVLVLAEIGRLIELNRDFLCPRGRRAERNQDQDSYSNCLRPAPVMAVTSILGLNPISK
jgi:hypothetical protein